MLSLEVHFKVGVACFHGAVVTIQNELLNLPATERARMIDFLWDSLSERNEVARGGLGGGVGAADWMLTSPVRLKARDAEAVFGIEKRVEEVKVRSLRRRKGTQGSRWSSTNQRRKDWGRFSRSGGGDPVDGIPSAGMDPMSPRTRRCRLPRFSVRLVLFRCDRRNFDRVGHGFALRSETWEQYL